jgi:hypothetical protein
MKGFNIGWREGEKGHGGGSGQLMDMMWWIWSRRWRSGKVIRGCEGI